MNEPTIDTMAEPMPVSTKEEQIHLRVKSDELERWRATADAEGLTLSAWIRKRCNEVAVDQELIDAVAKKLEERAARNRRQLGDLPVVTPTSRKKGGR